MKTSVSHSFIGPRAVGPMQFSQVENYRSLSRIGIGLDERMVRRAMVGMGGTGLDSLVSPVLAGNVGSPVQYLQTWLPGYVALVTQAQKIDELVGVQTVGAWEDEEIIAKILELTGKAQPYGDYNNPPLSSWNPNYERRTVMRFEEALRVGVLEEARAGRIGIDTAQAKREAAQDALDWIRNYTGFYGYNNGLGRTYGFLNDPNLPGYVSVATGAVSGSASWTLKTYREITNDFRSWFAALRLRSGDTIDPKKDAITVALPTGKIDYLSMVSDFGNSVQAWLDESYPNVRLVSAPELTGANGGADVAYIYAETWRGMSTDDGKTFAQLVPARTKLIGVDRDAKTYLEDYSNATAGVLCKRPLAVYRATGF